MKKLMNSRPFAALCLAVVIVLSVLLGGFRSVKKVQKKAYEAYYTDFFLYGEASSDMKKMSRYASKLYAVCSACGCADSEFADVVDKFDKAVGEPYLSEDLYESLFHLSSISYNLLSISDEATEQQKRSAKQYFSEMDATDKRLSRNNSYNQAAENYNKAISGFPANLFMKNAEKMIVFD